MIRRTYSYSIELQTFLDDLEQIILYRILTKKRKKRFNFHEKIKVPSNGMKISGLFKRLNIVSTSIHFQLFFLTIFIFTTFY